MVEPQYEIFAIRYAWRDAKRSDHFIGGDPHDGPMPMDYFTWVVRGEGRTIVVDTGFTAEVSAKRGRTHLRCPIETMSELGIDADSVDDVVLTHLHYDHVGNFHKFAKARFHLQTREMGFVTGPYMRYPKFGHSFEVEDVVGMVKLNFKGRVEQHNGDFELAPNVTLHHVGGHTPGLQIVRVMTKRGWVVLASDAAHYYENVERVHAFPLVFNVADMLEGHRRISAAADSPQHVVPGHDPLVLQRYPRVAGDEVGMVSLHLAPLSH